MPRKPRWSGTEPTELSADSKEAKGAVSADAQTPTTTYDMGRFFLFALLTWITGNPILAVLVIILLSLPGWWAGSRWAFRLSRKVRSWGEAGRLRRMLSINPHDAKARTDLGAILARQGRFREARAELEQALPRVDDLPEANYYLGLSLMNDGEVERGRALVEKALASIQNSATESHTCGSATFARSAASGRRPPSVTARPRTSTVPAWKAGTSWGRR